MARYTAKRIILLGLCWMYALLLHAQLAERFSRLGMENIRTVSNAEKQIIAYEDRVYRNSYEGVRKAIETALDGNETKTICLIILDENGIPQLKIEIPAELSKRFHRKECTLYDVYAEMKMETQADEELELLKGKATIQRSSWRPDLTVYPQLFLENSSFNKLYRYYISLAPALEMPLWKGAELTAQVIFPIVGNQKGELKQIRPGIVAISQGFYLGRNVYLKAAGGQFTNHRLGGQVSGYWRNKNGRWEAGAKLGLTIYSIFDNAGWTVNRSKPKVNASIYGRTYLPQWNTEITVEAARFVYGDYGIQGELVRHFGEYTVGLYGVYTGGDANAGFSFAVPLPGKKYKRWKGMRLKPADYFNYRYKMTVWGEYVDRKLGHTYNTVPGENRSKGFYQPDYIRYFLMKTTKTR